MKLRVPLAFLALALLSTLASAAYYVEPTTNVHGYDDSMYLHKDFAPKSDVFYTPFNAYRTYCSAAACPTATKVIQVRETPIKVSQPKKIIIQRTYDSTPPHYQNFKAYNKSIAYTYVNIPGKKSRLYL